MSRRVGAAWLVTTPGDPDVHELRGGAAVVWERLEEPIAVATLVSDLAAEGAAVDDLGAQVSGVVRSLQELGVAREVRA
jgi:hypothetical protein